MSKRKLIKTVLLLASVCVGLWQASKFAEVLTRTRSEQSIGGLLKQAHGKPASPPDLMGLLKGVQQPTPPLGEEKPDGIVVFSPDGKKLTEAEREALVREAERLRPKPR